MLLHYSAAHFFFNPLFVYTSNQILVHVVVVFELSWLDSCVENKKVICCVVWCFCPNTVARVDYKCMGFGQLFGNSWNWTNQMTLSKSYCAVVVPAHWQ